MEPKVRTKLIENVFSDEESQELYDLLLENLPWTEGIRSKKGFTRLACMLDPNELPLGLDLVVAKIHSSVGCTKNLLGVYVNYYRNGEDWTPSHTHPKQTQVVLSLGATRKLIVGTKEYFPKNGSVVIFGSSAHSVPKMEEVKEGRISIATFNA